MVNGKKGKFPLSLGGAFSPGDGGFKEKVVFALSIYPGVVAFGTATRWKVCPRLNARGSHALGVKLFYNISYL
eukprot:209669-Pelagomonas_calceolata.AAC.1